MSSNINRIEGIVMMACWLDNNGVIIEEFWHIWMIVVVVFRPVSYFWRLIMMIIVMMIIMIIIIIIRSYNNSYVTCWIDTRQYLYKYISIPIYLCIYMVVQWWWWWWWWWWWCRRVLKEKADDMRHDGWSDDNTWWLAEYSPWSCS